MRRIGAWLLVVGLVAACGGDGRTVERESIADATSSSTSVEAPPSPTSAIPTPTTLATTPRPDWLGTRVLPLRDDGLGQIQPTPDELVDRRFATVDLLPPPEADGFRSTVAPVPDDVVARSTWSNACPVDRSDLRYVNVVFWGFEGLAHTGELLVHVDAVDAVVAGFDHLFARRFPIEEMRITRADELDVPPTGDGNNTSAFVCRPSVGSTTWSQHAYGRAVDINPFHNPYVRGDVVIPELASSYAARPDLPGVLGGDDVAGFTSAGWGWGGTWRSSKDHMHLSSTGS
ncbi:MAG: M15 family metallopeptidase [Acidimicrobiales bacterium]|nr:M15 family metallopeptidase [Acidimicrobiales bacterium]